MRSPRPLSTAAISALALALFFANAWSQSSPEAPPPPPVQEGAIPILQVISAVAKTIDRKFVVDPRVRAHVLLPSPDASKLSYADFLAVLQVYGYTAVTDDNLMRVVPDSMVRQLSIPLVTSKQTRPHAEYVTKIIAVKSVPAAQLVPILRPLLPQQAHLVALPCTNVLILVDTFGNIRRLEEIVQSLDRGEPYEPEKCHAQVAAK